MLPRLPTRERSLRGCAAVMTVSRSSTEEGTSQFCEFKIDHKLPDTKNYSVQIEITPNTVKTFILDGTEWKLVDSWTTSGRDLTQGKFGLIIPGGDTFGLTNFKFIPK